MEFFVGQAVTFFAGGDGFFVPAEFSAGTKERLTSHDVSRATSEGIR
jgi:hypothetical protein